MHTFSAVNFYLIRNQLFQLYFFNHDVLFIFLMLHLFTKRNHLVKTHNFSIINLIFCSLSLPLSLFSSSFLFNLFFSLPIHLYIQSFVPYSLTLSSFFFFPFSLYPTSLFLKIVLVLLNMKC